MTISFKFFNISQCHQLAQTSQDPATLALPVSSYQIPSFLHSSMSLYNECIITFKGRVGFKLYLKGRPHPWKIKALVLADSTSGYVHNMYMYYGKEMTLLGPELPHTACVALSLLKGLHNMWYDLYVDKLYNSPLLAIELKKIGITVIDKYKGKTYSLTCQHNHRDYTHCIK